MRAHLLNRTFFSPGDRIAVAVSGGADSVALLALLLAARGELGIVVSVAHFNHRLRGEESLADAEFVQGLAKAYGVSCAIETATEVHERNVEALARRDRYAFFERLDVTKVATAHTADDQAETVLARLLRGSGPAGIAGILPERGRIVRPLLGVRRSDLLAWAKTQSLQSREDASNKDTHFLRNRIRHELIPQLQRDYNPQIVEVLCHAADIARSDEIQLRKLTEEAALALKPDGDGWKLSLTDLVQLSEALQRRLLREAIARSKGDLRRVDFAHIERIRRMALESDGAPKVVEVPGCRIARRKGELLFISSALSV